MRQPGDRIPERSAAAGPGASEGRDSRDYLHAYPAELVSFLLAQWKDPLFRKQLGAAAGLLPDRSQLKQVLSTCYQASLMEEEDRPVTFRLILRDYHLFPPDGGPPYGLYRLRFERKRPFNEYELRRLAPAADYYRTMIGVGPGRGKRLQIWGLVHSGARWMQPLIGGTQAIPPLPASPVIHVREPGSIAISLGTKTVASLNSGRISCPSQDIFSAPWFAECFASVRSEIDEMHEASRGRAKRPWARLAPEFKSIIGQQVVRRIMSLIRNSRHGGMLVYLPVEMGRDISALSRYISLKYPFREEEPRQRFLTLILRIMNTFAELHGDPADPEKVVGWEDYINNPTEASAILDEGIFELAHFIAALSAIDGAVVITGRQELLGFGGVISGDIPEVQTIARALDMEGRRRRKELSEEAGTRHRAAYRLCSRLRGAIAVVISQDGNARLVKWHRGAVTYWDLAPTGVPGF